MNLRWPLSVAVGIILVLISLYPQLNLRQLRGRDYNGVYAYNDLDETAYAAYLQALIDNRPRRNNPFTGIDDAPLKPLPESLFSIQFAAPYAIALPARYFGLDASTAFIFVAAFSAFITAFVIFELFFSLTQNALISAAGTLCVLCAGVLVVGEGALNVMISDQPAYPFFPFLRRYVPAVPFPVFWLFAASIWQMIAATLLLKRVQFCVLAAVCFAFLVYSYFYLWTTAAAWLVCLAVVWLIFRPVNWRQDCGAFAVLFLSALVTLGPYALMLSNRDAAIDNVQLLIATREPDFFRLPEILSFFSLALLGFGVWRKLFSIEDKIALFVLSFALVPFAVFNQQILTNRSLQPIHYQVFIVNYVSLLAFILTLFLLWKGRRLTTILSPRLRYAAALLSIGACIWGGIEAYYTTFVIQDANVIRDNARLAGIKLAQNAKNNLAAAEQTARPKNILSVNLLLGDDLPLYAPENVLWARHQHVFSGESAAQNKARFYHFLYFVGVNAEDLRQQLRENNVITVITLFGWDRLTSRLSTEAKALTESEIEDEAQSYSEFYSRFSLQEAAERELSYVVLDADLPFDFTNLDKWYERGDGEKIGDFILYKVKLRRELLDKK